MSALNASASIFSPSWMSMARRVLPSRLELKRCDGSGDTGPTCERQLDDLRVRLPGADNPVVRPDRSAPPLHLFCYLRVGFQDQRPHVGQSLPAPSPQVGDPLVDEPGSRFPGRLLKIAHIFSFLSKRVWLIRLNHCSVRVNFFLPVVLSEQMGVLLSGCVV